MGGWPLMLGGLIVWAVHFFVLYVIAETTGASAGARIAVLGVTAAGLVANGLILRAAVLLPCRDGFESWRRGTTLLGVGISTLGIVWQMLPALLSSF